MKDTDVQILCGCDAATVCPQGRVGAERRCVVVVPEDDLFRIVMQLPEFKRRYTVSTGQEEQPERNLETDERVDKLTPREERRVGAALELGKEQENFDSTSDERVTANNLMRHQYRPLSDDEKAQMVAVKDLGLGFVELLHDLGNTQPMLGHRTAGQSSRELSIAQTKIEEAVMWAVKHVTG